MLMLAAAVLPAVAADVKPAPAVNLVVSWRQVPWPPAVQPATPPGTVTVGTAGTAAAGGFATSTAGTHTVRTVPAADEGAAQRLLVRNGGQAQIALLRDDANAPPEWIWTAQGDQGLQSGSRRLAQRTALWVRVDWPGGRSAARLSFRFEQPVPDAADGMRGDAVQQVDGDVAVPLDQWQVVGHWVSPAGTGQALELRVTPVP